MRLALAQVNPTVGDVEGNAGVVASSIDAARAAGADLVVLPELCISGYPPRDLVVQEGFVEACAAAAKRIGESATRGITAVFGVPLPLEGGVVGNSLLAYRDNALIDYYDKRLLPTYDVFDEDRYFRAGERAVVIDVPSRGGAVRVGLSICEDLWRGEDVGFNWRYEGRPDPVAELAAAGATLIVNPSASPFVLGKGARHRDLLRRHATRHGVFIAAVNQVGGNDELIFDGHAAVYAPGGELFGAAPGFEEALLVVDMPQTGGAAPDPLLTAAPQELMFRALTLGVRDYLRKTGFSRAVLGLSGGIDSALTAAIAVSALGAENVLGLAMPSRYSSSGSREDALDLAARLGMRCEVVPIDGPFAALAKTLDGAFGGLGLGALGSSLPDVAEENLQSRIRGTIMMALSNRTGALLLTTGNKSELAVGYCTLYGDMNGGLAVLSDLSKRQVYAASRWINANFERCGFRREPIPERSITKAPSAELRPNQTDQDSLPPYDVLDAIVERYVEGRQSAARIVRETGIDAATVARVTRLIDTSEFKRKQAAVGLKITSVAFGSGRRMPIAQRWRG